MEQTPYTSMISLMYSDKLGNFQNYYNTGLDVQQPRYQHLTPVQMSFDLPMNQPESSGPPDETEVPAQRRARPQRHPRPVGCGTGGCLIRYPHSHD